MLPIQVSGDCHGCGVLGGNLEGNAAKRNASLRGTGPPTTRRRRRARSAIVFALSSRRKFFVHWAQRHEAGLPAPRLRGGRRATPQPLQALHLSHENRRGTRLRRTDARLRGRDRGRLNRFADWIPRGGKGRVGPKKDGSPARARGHPLFHFPPEDTHYRGPRTEPRLGCCGDFTRASVRR